MPNPKRLLDALYGGAKAAKAAPKKAAGGAVHMQDGGSPLDQFAAKSRGVSSLPGYGEGGLATRHAITVPELRDVPTGLAGYSVGEMKPGMALEKGSYLEHPTYNTVIPGRFMGGLEIMHDYRDLFPEATQRMRQTLKNNPKFQGPDARDPESQMFGTFGFQGAEQEVTQKLIDELAAREQLIKQLGILPYKKGGKVKKVKISDNSDAMQLELMRKKKHG